MENSVFIAQILGPVCLIIATWLILKWEAYLRIMEDYFKNTALVFFGGMLPLIIGLVVVLCHNVWVANWRIIITIYGWGGIIKGIWILFFPNSVSRFIQVYQKSKALVVIQTVVIIAIGVVLTIGGYFTG